MEPIDVLDSGYVRLVSWLGNDLAVVNAARASFAKESREMTDSDARLIVYLAEHGHSSPFRHAMLTFEVCAPLMVARQWWKYVVGSDHTMDGWNETSRRYVTMDPFFYHPAEWWQKGENVKQGNSGKPLPPSVKEKINKMYTTFIDTAMDCYKRSLDLGVAPEQARLFLPAYGMYTVWRWTCSLQSLAHFINQRVALDAQKEIGEYAKAVYTLASPLFPVTLNALCGKVA